MPVGQLLELNTRNELEYLLENATESLHRRAPPCLELRQPDSTGTRRYFVLRSVPVLDRRGSQPVRGDGRVENPSHMAAPHRAAASPPLLLADAERLDAGRAGALREAASRTA